MVNRKKKNKSQEQEITYNILKSLGLSVVLAGGMVIGGAGVAGAAVTWTPNAPTWTSALTGNYTLTSDTGAVSDKVATGVILNQTSGSLTLNNAQIGTATFGANFSGALILKGSGLATTARTSISGTTGTYTFNAGSSATLTNGASIGMNNGNLVMNGGTFNVSGLHLETSDEAEIWRRGGLLYGENGVDIKGNTEITLGDYGYITVGGDNVADSTLSVGGTSKVIMQGGAANTASLLRAADNTKTGENVTINGGTLEVQAGKFGVIASAITTIKSGAVNVDGTLNVVKALEAGAGKTTADVTAWTAGDTDITQSGGTVNVSSTGKLNFGLGTYAMTGGTANAELLTITDISANQPAKGIIAEKMTISGANTVVRAETIALAAASQGGSPAKLTISGGAVTTATLKMGQDDANGITISNGMLELTGGSLTVNSIKDEAGVLAVSGTGILNVLNGMTIAGAQAEKHISGGTLNIAGTGLDVSTLGNVLKTSDLGSADLNTTVLKGASTSALTVDTDAITLYGDGTKFLEAQSLVVNGSNGVLNLGGADQSFTAYDGTVHTMTTKGGTYAGTVIVGAASATNGTLTVNGGIWNLTNTTTGLEVKATGTLEIAKGTLDVSKGKLTVDNRATGFSAGVSGVLLVNKTDVAADAGYTTITGTVNKKMTGAGTMIVKGVDTKISLADYGNWADLLVNGSLTLQKTDGTKAEIDFTDSMTESGNVDGTDVKAGVDVGGNKIEYAVTGNTQGVAGSVSSGLVLTGVTGSEVTVNISSGTKLGLNSNGGEFISTDKAGTKTNVAVSTGQTLALTGAGTLNGNVALAGTGTLFVQGTGAGITQVGDINVAAGTVQVEQNAQLHADALNLSTGNVTINGGGSLNADTLTITDPAASLTVGNAESAGTLTAGNVDMNGATMFLDPTWENGAASSASLSFKGNDVNGKITVGQNSWVTLGTKDSAWFPTAFSQTKGLNWAENGITAALAIYSPQTLHVSNGGLTVNGSLTTLGSAPAGLAAPNTLYLAANSLLAVNAAQLGDKAALTAGAGSTATIISDSTGVQGAKLLLIDATVGKPVTVLEGFGTTTGEFSAGDVHFNNALLKYDAKAGFGTGAEAGKLTITPEFNVAAFESLQNAGLGLGGGNIARVYMERGTDIATNQFMENALNLSLHGDNFHSMAMSLESGLDTARAVDTMGAGMMTVSATSSLALDRAAGNGASNSVGLSGGSASGLTFGLWGMPTYAHEALDNAKIDGTSYRVDSKTDTFGGIIGADLTFGAEQNYRVGAAFNVGSGDSEAKALNVKTKNDFDYVGGALYAAGMYDKFRLAGIVGYTSIDNDIKQDQLGGQLKSKPDADIWNFGVEASYTFTFGDGINVIPSLGLEWLHYSQNSYNTTLNNVAVVNVASASANRVNLPIGVKLNKTFALSESSSITPEVRAAIIPSFGSEMDTTASLPGILGANGSMRGINTDNVAGEVGLGLSVNLNQNFSLAAGYDMQFSKNRTNHNVNAMLRVKF